MTALLNFLETLLVLFATVGWVVWARALWVERAAVQALEKVVVGLSKDIAEVAQCLDAHTREYQRFDSDICTRMEAVDMRLRELERKIDGA